MAKKQCEKGFSLIEVVIFIVVMSLLAAGVMRAFMLTSSHGFELQYSAQALNLAQARMELLLGQAAGGGFQRLTDPCAKSGRPPVCLSSPGYRVTSAIRYDQQRGKNFKVITVEVKKPGDNTGSLILTSLVAKK